MPDIDLSIDRPKMKSYFFGSQKAEGRRQDTEDRRQKTEDRRQKNPESRTPRRERAEVRQLWPLRPGDAVPRSRGSPISTPFHGADGAGALQGIGWQWRSGRGNKDRWRPGGLRSAAAAVRRCQHHFTASTERAPSSKRSAMPIRKALRSLGAAEAEKKTVVAGLAYFICLPRAINFELFP
jgi:hypothetical protein